MARRLSPLVRASAGLLAASLAVASIAGSAAGLSPAAARVDVRAALAPTATDADAAAARAGTATQADAHVTRPARPIPPRLPGPAGLSSALAAFARDARVAREPSGRLAAERATTGEDVAPSDPGLLSRPGASGPSVAVSVALDAAPDGPAVAAAVAGLGGSVVGRGSGLVEAYVPAQGLADLATTPGVRRVDPIRRPFAGGFTSAGVAIQGADAWQAAGFGGQGVRIGILDGGFSGLSDRLASEFPGGVQARCYSGIGAFSASLAACEADGEPHGTAVVETIADMAPGATLYVSNPISFLDVQSTIAWMTGQGVRIVNASFGSGDVFEGPGDGTSPYPDSYYRSVDAAVGGGALWVNSAGNSGELGWTGPWTDANGNGWLEFAGTDETDSLALQAGERIAVAIRWSDPWGSAADDYDLYLYPAGGDTPVASSTDRQDGTGDPVERLDFTATTAGTYDIQVARHAGAPVSRMQLLVESDSASLSHPVAAGTLPAPADSANPGMVTVGAVGVATPGVVEPYSSRGPTSDGRTKPDLVAIDCAATTVIAQFCGTSQSAPYVSGAAALLVQAQPSLTPSQLADAVRAHTAPLGTTVPDPASGWGRLSLGTPPTGPPPAPPPSPPTGPPPLGLTSLSPAGSAIGWRSLATSGTLVHLLFGQGSATDDEVVYRRSTDGGATFATAIALSAAGMEAGYPAIATGGSAVHAAWLEGDLGGVGPVVVWYRSSPDGGASWSAPRALSPLDGRAGNPAVAADGSGRVLVGWTDADAGRVLVAVSADDGATFAAARAVGSTTLTPFTGLADLDGLPSVALGTGGRAYVAWSSGETRVLVRRSADGGASWLPVEVVDRLADGYSRPWLSAYGGGVALAYAGRLTSPGRTLAFVRRSSDGGATWQPRRLVSASTAYDTLEPAVTARGAVLRVAWAQCTSSACARARIWYRQSSTGGATWSPAAALTGSSTFALPTGLAATSRILVLYDAAGSSSASAATVYLLIR